MERMLTGKQWAMLRRALPFWDYAEYLEPVDGME